MRTYADVADTLPADIREAIETSMPCPVAVTREHLWDHERFEVTSLTEQRPVRVDEWWRCVYCGALTHTDPTPAIEHPGPLLSAAKALKLMNGETT